MKILGFEIKKKSSNIVAQRNSAGVIDFTDNISKYLGVFNSRCVDSNAITLFEEISEVNFPIMAIVRRAVNGKFELKSTKDDSVIYDNEKINKFLSKPNFYQTFNEFLIQALCYKLVTGKAYIYGGIASQELAKNRWKVCNSYVVLPSQDVRMVTFPNIPFFTAESISDVVNYYSFSSGGKSIEIEPYNLMHVRDVCLKSVSQSLEGDSRLNTVKYPVSNLIETYEARNAIYVKRGAIGVLISTMQDEAGSRPILESDKNELLNEFENSYGTGSKKHPVMISRFPVDFKRFNMSIRELQPFDEHLEDATQIAGVYNIPPAAIPRATEATFDNQDLCERAIYMNAVIPEAKSFVMALNEFLGLENSGQYLDVSFDHISVLQPNWKEKAETDKITTETSKENFLNGIITLNEWKASLGMDRVNEKIYDKYILSMNEEEINLINTIIKGMPGQSAANNNNDNNLQNENNTENN